MSRTSGTFVAAICKKSEDRYTFNINITALINGNRRLSELKGALLETNGIRIQLQKENFTNKYLWLPQQTQIFVLTSRLSDLCGTLIFKNVDEIDEHNQSIGSCRPCNRRVSAPSVKPQPEVNNVCVSAGQRNALHAELIAAWKPFAYDWIRYCVHTNILILCILCPALCRCI